MHPRILVLATCLLSFIATVFAQQTPSPVQEMGFARVGSKLYIQGGKFETNSTVNSVTGQLFSLDLATPWSTAAPAWMSHAPGRQMYFMNAVSAPDNSSFYTIYVAAGNSFVFTKYDINLDQWSAPYVTKNDTESRTITRPVINPQTGLVYLDGSSYMNVVNLASQSLVPYTVPPNTFTSRLFSGAVFNAPRNSVMYFGGLNYSIKWDLDATYVTEYNIALNTWSNFTTQGEPPSPRADFCMQGNDDGTKIVVFGGRIPTNTSTSPPVDFTGTLHILDVPTGQWTQGPSGDIRLYMACVIVGDQFIAWGGSKGGGYTYDGPPVVFDLTKMQWVTTYTPPAYLLNAPKPTAAGQGATSSGPHSTSPTAAPSAKDSNLGAILGGVFGSLFVIALAALIYVYVLRRKDKVKYAAPVAQKLDGDNGGPERRAVADGLKRRDPQEMAGLTHQTLERSPMYSVNLDSKDYATNTIATPPGTNYTQINPGFVPNNVPMLYAPQTGYTTGPVAPGGVIMLPNGQQANVVYLTQHPCPGIPPISNGTIFNTNMASYGNNTVPVSQAAYSDAIYNTSGPHLDPTTTQQYMDGFVHLTNPSQHSTFPIASVVDHVQMPVQSPLTAQYYAGTPVSVAPAPDSLANEGSASSTPIHSSSAHDRQAYVGGHSASSLSRNHNNRRRSSELSLNSEAKNASSSGAVVPLPVQEGSQYYTATVPGYWPGQTSEVNVNQNQNQNQNQSYQLPPPIPPRIS
ncbi:hypothetical protein BG006_011220 [Podila minutissima]|uniref:Uncharacterized protein n=1 Tax=Podila minutissima TaxID=64525 RepID=A0A9P5SC37_9FUNG|nr:hypothetical protein BG006_011220 [Podila minutissima]